MTSTCFVPKIRPHCARLCSVGGKNRNHLSRNRLGIGEFYSHLEVLKLLWKRSYACFIVSTECLVQNLYALYDRNDYTVHLLFNKIYFKWFKKIQMILQLEMHFGSHVPLRSALFWFARVILSRKSFSCRSRSSLLLWICQFHLFLDVGIISLIRQCVCPAHFLTRKTSTLSQRKCRTVPWPTLVSQCPAIRYELHPPPQQMTVEVNRLRLDIVSTYLTRKREHITLVNINFVAWFHFRLVHELDLRAFFRQMCTVFCRTRPKLFPKFSNVRSMFNQSRCVTVWLIFSLAELSPSFHVCGMLLPLVARLAANKAPSAAALCAFSPDNNSEKTSAGTSREETEKNPVKLKKKTQKFPLINTNLHNSHLWAFLERSHRGIQQLTTEGTIKLLECNTLNPGRTPHLGRLQVAHLNHWKI